MDAFEVLSDPVRRRIVELLAAGEQPSGAVTAVIREEFGISQPAVSQHLKVLRDSGFATVRAEGTQRFYALDQTGLSEVDSWLVRVRSTDASAADVSAVWNQRLDAFATELARGRRAARQQPAAQTQHESQTPQQKETA